jgi:NAD(P)-dependent dehydrogenase (short-subunit alcohol dehydrogenase family)
VNLAGGLTCYKPAVEHSLDDWNHELNNNLLSAFLASRAVFPHMRDAGGGAVISFARAGLSQANMVAYLRQGGNIRVNAVAPGLVDTASNVAAMKPKDMKRWTKRSDIAETVVFLASEGAAGITGQMIAVTGWGL